MKTTLKKKPPNRRRLKENSKFIVHHRKKLSLRHEISNRRHVKIICFIIGWSERHRWLFLAVFSSFTTFVIKAASRVKQSGITLNYLARPSIFPIQPNKNGFFLDRLTFRRILQLHQPSWMENLFKLGTIVVKMRAAIVDDFKFYSLSFVEWLQLYLKQLRAKWGDSASRVFNLFQICIEVMTSRRWTLHNSGLISHVCHHEVNWSSRSPLKSSTTHENSFRLRSCLISIGHRNRRRLMTRCASLSLIEMTSFPHLENTLEP